MDVCLSLAATAFVLARLPQPLTLSWRHSVEGTVIEEDYAVDSRSLRLEEIRVRGPAAGIEPPEEARFRDGVWRYRPALPPLAQVHFANAQPGYVICAGGRCMQLDALAGTRRMPFALAACGDD